MSVQQDSLGEASGTQVQFPKAFDALPAELEIVPERTANVSCYFSINGKVYGVPEQTRLKNKKADDEQPEFLACIATREPNLPGELRLKVSAGREQNPSANPQGTFSFRAEVMFDLAHVDSLDIHIPGEYTLGGHFRCPADWDGSNIALITLKTKKAFALHPSVPPLLKDPNGTKAARLQSIFDDLRNLNKSGEAFEVQILFPYRPHPSRGTDIALTSLERKYAIDKKHNVLHRWFMDSPNEHKLLQENIYPVGQAPPLSIQGIILENRRNHASELSWLVPRIYAIQDERNCELAVANEYAESPFKAAFMEVAASRNIQNFPEDKNLANLYVVSVDWSGHQNLERPRQGDKFKMILPFPVPDCPEPTGDEDAQGNNGGDIKYTGPTNAAKNATWLQLMEEHAAASCRE